MKTAILLVMHGMPPKDFPEEEKRAFFALRPAMERADGAEKKQLEQKFNDLDERMRTWPRDAKNDPYYEAAQKLAKALEEESKMRVFLAFNEFCAPTLEKAARNTMRHKPERVFVTTPMLTPGGNHAGREIPHEIKKLEEKYPGTSFVYVWPFDTKETAAFMAGEIRRFV